MTQSNKTFKKWHFLGNSCSNLNFVHVQQRRHLQFHWHPWWTQNETWTCNISAPSHCQNRNFICHTRMPRKIRCNFKAEHWIPKVSRWRKNENIWFFSKKFKVDLTKSTGKTEARKESEQVQKEIDDDRRHVVQVSIKFRDFWSSSILIEQNVVNGAKQH